MRKGNAPSTMGALHVSIIFHVIIIYMYIFTYRGETVPDEINALYINPPSNNSFVVLAKYNRGHCTLKQYRNIT